MADDDFAKKLALAQQFLVHYPAYRVGLLAPPKLSIFRYIDFQNETVWDRLHQTIVDSRLPLTTPTTLNDPFDSNPNIVNDLIGADINHALREFRATTKSGHKVNFNTETIQVQRDDGSILSAKEVEAMVIDNAIRAVRERITRTGMASFSSMISSQLLWAHYANGYRGAAYHFIVSDRSGSPLTRARPVNYVGQRPIILTSEVLRNPSAIDEGNLQELVVAHNLEDRLFFQKSEQWKYEEERRIVQLGKSEVDFHPEELFAIIIGPAFPEEPLTRLRALIAARSRPLKVFRAEVSKTEYSIEVDWNAPL